jgi:hypothetical protein
MSEIKEMTVIICERPIGELGRKRWVFVVEEDELVLDAYHVQNKLGGDWQDIISFLRGRSCLIDRINVIMPADIIREAMSLCPGAVYCGVSYAQLKDFAQENPDAVKAIRSFYNRDTASDGVYEKPIIGITR